MKDQIISIISRKGPVVPTDISGELQANSYVISALLSEMVKENLVFYSHKKMTTSPLYYLKGQEELVRKRLFDILKIPEKNILAFFEKNKLASKDSLEPQQRYMVDELRDFIIPLFLDFDGEKKQYYRHYSVSEYEIFEKLNKWKEGKKESADEKKGDSLKIEKAEAMPKKEKTSNDDESKKNDSFSFPDSPSKRFFGKNLLVADEMTEVKKGKEYDFMARQESGISQAFFVKYYKKSSINDSDISKAYALAQSKKMPCIILITGKLSKKAQELALSLGSLINIMNI